MRVRLVMKMATHFHLYLSHEFFSKMSCPASEDPLLQRFSEEYSDRQSAAKALQGKIFVIRKPSKECGMWHLFTTANILHSKVMIIFPDKGEEDMRSLAKRTIVPQRDQSATSTKFIMWTTHREDLTDEHWVPSHFVPLLPLHPVTSLWWLWRRRTSVTTPVSFLKGKIYWVLQY